MGASVVRRGLTPAPGTTPFFFLVQTKTVFGGQGRGAGGGFRLVSRGDLLRPQEPQFFFLVQTKTVFGGQGRGAGGVFRLVSRMS